MRRETLEMTGTEEVKTCFRIGGGLVGGLLLSFGRRGMKSRRRRGLGQGSLEVSLLWAGLGATVGPCEKMQGKLGCREKSVM